MSVFPVSAAGSSVRVHQQAFKMGQPSAPANGMPVQLRRGSALRNPANGSSSVVIVIAVAMVTALFANPAARAQSSSSMMVSLQYAGEQITDRCGSVPPQGGVNERGITRAHWLVCAQTASEIGVLGVGLSTWVGAQPSPGNRSALPPRTSTGPLPDAASAFALALGSGTAKLPFLGNQLVEVGFVPNAASFDAATAVYATGLVRQSDCSLDEDFIDPVATTPNAASIASLTGAQDYLHQLAGLTTKPDVFANGCASKTLGLPARGSVLLLGETSGGAAITAQLASNGLFVTVTDSTANTDTTTQLTTGSNPGYFAAASLRRNGIMDLVETGLTDPATSAAATAVLLGNGDGTFQKPVYYDVADTIGGQGGFVVDDVNGDGVPDIVILKTASIAYSPVETFTGTVTTFIGKGDGSFTMGPVSNVTWTDSLLTNSGDFNNDGKKDLLIGGTVLLGAGNGSFTQGTTNMAIAGGGFTGVYGNAVGSLRNNGKLDVVVTEPGFVTIYYGNGDGTFQTGPSYAALPDFMQVTITDIDGDGNPDIVLGTSSGGIYTIGGYDTPTPMYQILMGRGDGTFVDSSVYLEGSYRSDKNIASADFNGDGKADVLVFNRSNGITANSLLMLPGDGTGALGAAVSSTISITPAMMVAAKMKHDTLADAVVAGSGSSAAPELAVLFNQGNGTFAGELDYTLNGSAVSLAGGDFNGDGIPDVAVGESGQGVYVFFGQANGTLGTPVQVDTSANPTGLAAGSLTTDGRTDLIVADQTTGALHVYLGNANQTFTSVTAPTIGATNLNLAALGDLNNDGKLDLILAGFIPGSSGNENVSNVYTLLGNGDGTFKAANALSLAGNDVGAASIALADFNKDGKLDVVVGNPDDVTEVLLGNGDGTLAGTAVALGERPATVAAADLLGNGYPEILVGEGDTQGQGFSLTVLRNQGASTSSTLTTPTVTVSPSPTSITTAQSTTVTISVSGGTGNPTPTGSVILSSGSYTSATTTLTSGSAAITVAGSALATATDTLSATYTPDTASSTVYNSAAGTNSVTVTTPPAPGFALSNGGSLSFEAGATTGDTGTITVSASNGFTGAVNLACAVSMAPTGATSPVTCSVPSSVTISGTTAQNATLTVASTTTTTAGAYAVTVTGTSGAITTTTTVNITVTAFVAPPSFALTSGAAITIGSPGATTGNTTTITVTPSGGFTGSVTLTAALTSSPAGAVDSPTFSFGSTSPVSITGAAGTGTLTVSTTAATTAALARPARPNTPGGLWTEASGAALACLLLFGFLKRSRRLRSLLGLLVLLVFLAASISSCGGGGGTGTRGNPGTTTGSYTITVSGNSGSVTQTTTVNLTVN